MLRCGNGLMNPHDGIAPHTIAALWVFLRQVPEMFTLNRYSDGRFSRFSFLRCNKLPAILLQRGIAFRGAKQPFLGVSSLNLAAPSGAAFFCLSPRRDATRFAVDERATRLQPCAPAAQRIPR
jgi:hypothetical protein